MPTLWLEKLNRKLERKVMSSDASITKIFSLAGKVAIITGGAGMLGAEYAAVLKEAGAVVIVWDVAKTAGMRVDITKKKQGEGAVGDGLKKNGGIEIFL